MRLIGPAQSYRHNFAEPRGVALSSRCDGAALFLLTARRDLDAAKSFSRKMLKDGPLLAPDQIGTDGAGTYPGAIAAAPKKGRLSRDPVHHVIEHLQHGIESDHFWLKKTTPRIGGFRSFNTARRSIQGFEAMLWMRKGFGFAGPWTTLGGSRVPELGPLGSVRGALSNERPYRDLAAFSAAM